MPASRDIRGFGLIHGLSPALAGVAAGLVAGAAYLVAQASFHAAILGRAWPEPLQRIAAMLLGEDAAPPPAELSLTIVGFALLIHFSLAIVYGRIVERLTVRASPAIAAARGGAFGVFLYAVNFLVVAPVAFPWFEASPIAVTLLDHVLFGAVAGLACVVLREPAQQP